jgi:hypothetical protein
VVTAVSAIHAWPLTRESVECQLDWSNAARKHATWGGAPSPFRVIFCFFALPTSERERTSKSGFMYDNKIEIARIYYS